MSAPFHCPACDHPLEGTTSFWSQWPRSLTCPVCAARFTTPFRGVFRVGLWILAVHGVADLVYNLFFLEGPIALGTLLRDAVFPILLVGDFLVRRANRRLSAARSLSTADQPGK